MMMRRKGRSLSLLMVDNKRPGRGGGGGAGRGGVDDRGRVWTMKAPRLSVKKQVAKATAAERRTHGERERERERVY
jgi:hypothetical protein